MKHQKVAVSAALAIASGVFGMASARADVAWQHNISVQVPGQKVPASAVLQLAWKGDGQQQRSRLAWYGGAMSSQFAGMNPQFASYATGHATLVTRLNDDRVLAFSSVEKTAIEAPRGSWLGASRLNPWQKGEFADAQLANQDVPQLTLEQRRRLGRELRAVARPFSRRVQKTYFRALPGTVTIKGLTGRGYRFTSLTIQNKQPIARFVMEWYLADEQPGDEAIRTFTKASRAMYSDPKGYPTASIWINELLPVLYQTLPDEVQRTIETFSPPQDSSRAGFGGTPLQISLSVYDSSRALFSNPGADSAVRINIVLSSRSTSTLPERVFAIPAGYTRKVVTPQDVQKLYDDAQRTVEGRAGMRTLNLFGPL